MQRRPRSASPEPSSAFAGRAAALVAAYLAASSIGAAASLGATAAAAFPQLAPPVPPPIQPAQPGPVKPPAKSKPGDGPAVLQRGPAPADRDLAPDAEAVGPTLPSAEELAKRTIAPLAEELTKQLSAHDYAARRAASERLQGGEVALEDLLAILARGGLDAEAHHRLLAISFDRIVNAPRGALGIQMEPVGGGDGVRLSRVISGFPAEKVLQVDDIIVAIDGRAIRGSNDLLAVVQGHPPGTEVRIEAIRAERDARGKVRLDDAGSPVTRRIDVRVALGSKRELDSADPVRAMRQDPIDTARQETGRLLLRRFAAPMQNVRLPDDAKVEAEFAARDVERHELVLSLAAEIDDARAAQRPLAPAKVGWFRSQIRAIRGLAEEPSSSPAERAWYGRVADRLESLLEAGLRDAGS